MQFEELKIRKITDQMKNHLADGDLKAAIACEKEHEEILHGRADFYVPFTQALSDGGLHRQAIEILFKILKMVPDPVVAKKLSDLLVNVGREGRAIDVLWGILGGNFRDVDVIRKLIIRYTSLNDYAATQEMYRLLRTIQDPSSVCRPSRNPRARSHETLRIVIVDRRPRARSRKIAHAIREFGGHVILIHHLSFSPVEGDPYKTSISYDSLKDLRETLLKIRTEFEPDLIHVFCDGFGYTDAVIVMVQATEPVVWDYHDLTNVSYHLEKAPEYTLSMELERWCIQHADGICARNREMQVAKRRGIRPPHGNFLFFPEYCYDNVPRRPKLGDKDGRLHIFLSDVLTEPGNDPNAYNCIRPFFERFAGIDSIQFHIYASQPELEGVDLAEKFPGYFELAEKQDNVEFYPTVSERDYLINISQFDLYLSSISILNPSYWDHTPTTDDHTRCFYTNKFADCLDVDLLYCKPDKSNRSSDMDICRWLTKRWGLGFAPTPEEMGNPTYWEGVRKYVRGNFTDHSSARQQWSIRRQAPRLEAFYQRILHSNPSP